MDQLLRVVLMDGRGADHQSILVTAFPEVPEWMYQQMVRLNADYVPRDAEELALDGKISRYALAEFQDFLNRRGVDNIYMPLPR